MPAPAPLGQNDKVLSFRVGDLRLAVPASDVAQVLRAPHVTRVPHAPASLSGVANLRGAVVPILSLARLLGQESAAATTIARIILLDRTPQLGLAVDEVTAFTNAGTTTDPSAASSGARLFLDEDGSRRLIDLDALLAREFGAQRRTVVAALATAETGVAVDGKAVREIGLLGFELARQSYALPLEYVREVMALPPGIVSMPRLDDALVGVVAYRGGLLPLASLRALLGLAPADPDAFGRVVITSIGDSLVGLVVDRLNAVLRAPESAIGAVPTVLNRGAGEAQIDSIFRQNDGAELVSILSPEHLFREDTIGNILAEARDRETAAVNESDAGQRERFVIFRLGEETYGLPIGSVDEVARLPDPVTRIPRAPAFVEGVMNFRGKVIPLIDLRRRFDVADQATLGRRRVLVTRIGDLQGGLHRRCRVRGGRPDPGTAAPDAGAARRRRRDPAIRPRCPSVAGWADGPAGGSGGDARPGRGRSAESDGRGGRRVDHTVIKLLIVDDSPLMRRLLDSVFKAAGDFEIAIARNGAEALQQLHSFKPDVITLDIQMPEMDGLACLDRIMIERPTPVLMVSSMTEAGAAETLEAIGLGAVDFIAKPTRAISLEIDGLAPSLVEKARAAAKARLRLTHRLTERVRARIGEHIERSPLPTTRPRAPLAIAATGDIMGCVLVGASTGGPPALDALLAALPADFPWPVVVAQHMPVSFTGPLARRLDGLCALDVREVVRPMPLVAGHVYIGRGDADLIIARRASGPIVQPAPSSPDFRWHPSVDRLVDSAIEHLGANRLLGVLMTGMGNDGAAAMTRLHGEGGHTIAEAEETAIVWGMPGALVQAGGADIIAPLDEIAARVLDLVGHP